MNRTAPQSRAPAGSDPRAPARHAALGTFRGPFARWPRAADAVLALVSFFVLVFVADAPGDELDIRQAGEIPIFTLPIYAVASVALYWRRRAPLVVLGIGLAAWTSVLGVDYTVVGIGVIIALYSVGRYAATDRRWAYAAIAATIALIAIDGPSDPSMRWQELGFGSFVMFMTWYIGHRLRLREERAAELIREQAAEARRIVTEERTRIARELHDVVAHRVSLMTVQAGAAKAVAPQDPEGALRAMGAVEEAGRQALEELRHLLGVLRPEADEDGLGPQPGLANVPRLVDQIRGAGVPVTLSADGVPDGLPDRVDLFAYRIIQEALTNVLKHAGPGTHTDVRIDTDKKGVVIEVFDDGRGSTSIPERHGGQGHGIVGMRERALLLGGTLDAGPRPDGGGFRVVAHLPTGGEPS